MRKWSFERVGAIVSALFLMSSPIRAQLPTMEDVDRGSEAASVGPLPEWDVASVKPHAAEDHM